MKKVLFLLTLILAMTLPCTAQSTQIATLSHEGTITTFSSANALRNAYEQAVDGDVISLSAGVFNSQNIEKRITVRGAGMGVKVNDTDPYIEPTIITGQISFKADATSSHHAVLEGLIFESRFDMQGVSGAQFQKCKFAGEVDYTTNNGSFENLTVLNCVFSGESISFCYNSTTNFIGCYLKDPYFGNNSTNVLTNCVVELTKYISMNQCNLKNSVVSSTHSEDNAYYLTAYNTIYKGKMQTNSTFYTTLADHNNVIVPAETELFKEGTFYQLTDAAKAYLGSDGTEVGIYGGTLPFDPTPTNPQITKFNVASKTTADGKLSVDIEVNVK